jgi:hypothetical protein
MKHTPNPNSPSLRSRLAGIALLLVAASLPAAAQTAFRLTSGPANTSGSLMTLDHPALNGKPKVKPLVTQYWSAVYNPHPVGVLYNPAIAKWMLVNEDGANIPADAKFNILIAKGTKTVLASAANSTSNVTMFPTAKGNPNALLLATHVANPLITLPPTYSPRYHGVFFVPASSTFGNQWSIIAEDEENIEAIGFHVADVTKLKNGSNPGAFLLTTSGANINGNSAIIDTPLTNDNPNAFVYIQHVYSIASPTYLDKPLGVYYVNGKWRIFTQDGSAMPNNCAFVVAVIPGTGV